MADLAYSSLMGRAQGRLRDQFSPILGDERGLRADQVVPDPPVAPSPEPVKGDAALPMSQTTPIGPNTYRMAGGEVISRVHDRTPDCDKHGCAIHNPSKHSMDDLPMHLRSDTGLIERLCPHGTGHPDPDSMAYILRQDPSNSWIGIHGCCGVNVDGVLHACCGDEARAERDKATTSTQP